jgi:hypothetical protein
MNQGLKQYEKTIWSMTVVRIGVDSSNTPFVEVKVTETNEQRRLYVGDVFKMQLDLTDIVEESQ